MSYDPEESGPWSDTDDYPVLDTPDCPICGRAMVPMIAALGGLYWQPYAQLCCPVHPWVSGGAA